MSVQPAPALDLIAGPASAPDAAAAAEDVPALAFDQEDGWVFDEIRLGGSTFLKHDVPHEEDGVFINGQVLFDPLLDRFKNAFADALLRPRPHLGFTASAGPGTDQLYGGLTWTFPIFDLFFLEASFGGTVHDGETDNERGDTSLALGCRALFRESIGIGVNLGPDWRIIAAADHSSNASLCDYNDGLSHIGASIGYRF